MRKVTLILMFLSATLVFSCENAPVINCSDCLSQEPVDADLTINLDGNATSAEVTVYEGDIEDNVIFRSFSYTTNRDATVKVPINKKYAVIATYRFQDSKGTYTAVDSAFPRVKYDETQCENPCYYIYDNNVNLRIRYQ